MENFRTYKEIADILKVSIDTIRRNIRAKKSELGLKPQKVKTPDSKGALVGCLSIDDSDKLIRYYETKGIPEITSSSARNFGYFYIIQLIPEFHPKRVKIGYADDVDKRFKEHQTASPTARLLGFWPCKRSWDQSAMGSITRSGCKLVLNEVYEGDIDGFMQRAKEFFNIMPDDKFRIEISEHSPLKSE